MKATFPFVFTQGNLTETVEAFTKEGAATLMQLVHGDTMGGYEYNCVRTFDAILLRIKSTNAGKLTGIEFVKTDGSKRKTSFNPLWSYKTKGTGRPLPSDRFMFLESFNSKDQKPKTISLYKDKVVKFKINKQEVFL